MTDSNVEVDFHRGVQRGEVNFAFQYGKAPLGPTVDIPDEKIQVFQSFSPILLDDYVDDMDEEIKWGHSDNKELVVSIVNRVATIRVPDPN